jgi:hypothetical protein
MDGRLKMGKYTYLYRTTVESPDTARHERGDELEFASRAASSSNRDSFEAFMITKVQDLFD